MEEPREGLFLDIRWFIQKKYSSCCYSSILFCTTRERLVGDRVKQVLLGHLHTAIWCLGLHERCDHGLGVKASQITVGLSGTNENNGLARDVGHGDGGTHLPGTSSTVKLSHVWKPDFYIWVQWLKRMKKVQECPVFDSFSHHKEAGCSHLSSLLTLSSMVSNLVRTIPSMSRGVWAME